MTALWPWLLFLAAIYCVVQTVRDWRAGNYRMAVAGGICAALLLLAPLQSHIVKLDIPAAR